MKLKPWMITGLCLCCLLYAEALFSQEKYPNEKFVIVLDVQQYWTGNTLPGNESAEMLKSINTLVRNTNPGKVIYIKTSAVQKTLSVSLKGIKVDTVFASEFDSGLIVVNDIIFEKTTGNAFAEKKLDEYLASRQAKEIIITGLLAENCVLDSVLGGLSDGYQVYVLPEAIGSKSAKRKQKVLREIEGKGCKILHMNDLVPVDN